MFDLLDLIRKLLSQIIIGVRIIRWFGLMDELRYINNQKSRKKQGEWSEICKYSKQQNCHEEVYKESLQS